MHEFEYHTVHKAVYGDCQLILINNH